VSAVLVTLALGPLLGPASRLRGQNTAQGFALRLFLACRRSIRSGVPTLTLPQRVPSKLNNVTVRTQLRSLTLGRYEGISHPPRSP